MNLPIDSEAIRALLAANSALQRRVAVASARNQPGRNQPEWLDELLLASKSVAAAVYDIERQLPRRHAQ